MIFPPTHLRRVLTACLLAFLLMGIVAVGCLWVASSVPGPRPEADADASGKPEHVRAKAHRAEYHLPRRPAPVLASIPWKRTTTQPVGAFVPLARVAWQNDLADPVEAKVSLAGVPWQRVAGELPRKGANLAVAVWPWRANVEPPRAAQVPLAAVPWVLDSERPVKANVRLAVLPEWPAAKPATRPTSGPALSDAEALER